MARKKNTKYIWLTGIVVVLAIVFIVRAPLSVFFFQKIVEKRMASNTVSHLVDGLHVGLCGAGSPIPDPERSAPCTLIIAGDRIFVFDAGVTAAQNIGRMQFNVGKIEALFLTHFHSDHIGGIGELMLQHWVGGLNYQPLAIYGPDGTDDIVNSFNNAYSLDKGYRIAHHGAVTIPPTGFGGKAHSFTIAPDASRIRLISEPDLEITAFAVDHSPIYPAVGYSIRYKDRTIVISGDTKKSVNLQREAHSVDLLVHEALSPELVGILEQSARIANQPARAKLFKDIVDYHTSPNEAAEIARDADVGALLLTHIVPMLPLPGMQSVFLDDASKIFEGSIYLGKDGDFVSLPAGTKDIVFDNRF